MNRTILITIVSVGAICGVVLIAKGSKNRALDERADESRDGVEALERQLLRAEPLTAVVRRTVPVGDGLEEAIAKSRAESTPEERIARSKKQLGIVVAEMGDVSRSPGAFFKALPDILRIIQDLSTDEMFELAESLETPVDMSEPEAEGVARMVLYMLVAEHDPLRVIQNSELMENRELRQSLIGQFARSDPKAAREWVANSDLSDSEKRAFNDRLVMLAFRENIQRGIQQIREIHENRDSGDSEGDSPFRSLRNLPLAKARLPEVVAAANDPANEDLRSDLLSMAMNSATMSGGVASAREQAGALNLSELELTQFLQRQNQELVDADPQATMEWISELSDEQQLGVIPGAIRNWARGDFNAAGDWLGEMEPSRIRDESIEQFAQTVVRVDPKAALIWANQIQDEELRSRAIRLNAGSWRAMDREAAEAWLVGNGYDAHGSRIPE